MKVVILAAGIGSRLGQSGCPKTLSLLSNGRTILDSQIAHLSTAFPLSSIYIVVGYRKEDVAAHLQNLQGINYVVNLDYASENTSKSLLKAVEGIDDDLLWVNGDVVFKREIIKKVVTMTKSCMVVTQGAVGDEEVKYRANGEGRILEVSKTVQKGEGEAVGINLFVRQDLPALRESLGACAPTDYFEKAIESCLKKGVVVQQLVVGRDDCVEIDFPEDLDRANLLLSRWEKEKDHTLSQ